MFTCKRKTLSSVFKLLLILSALFLVVLMLYSNQAGTNSLATIAGLYRPKAIPFRSHFTATLPPSHHIAIVTTTRSATEMGEWKTALSTMRCYAGVQNYSLYHIFIENDNEADQLPHSREWEREAIAKCVDKRDDEWRKDHQFDRFCILAELMLTHPEHDYVLHVDSDIGVINPQRRLEEFIENDEQVDLYFYMREAAWDISSATFLIRNNKRARNFVRKIYEMKRELPIRLNVTYEHLMKTVFVVKDNGVLHELFMYIFATENETNTCDQFILTPMDLSSIASSHKPELFQPNEKFALHPYYPYEACTLYYSNKHSLPGPDGAYYYNAELDLRIKVFSKYKSWVRDGSRIVTEGWNMERDFMLHAWKESVKDVPHEEKAKEGLHYWENPFLKEEPFAAEQCSAMDKLSVIQRYWRDRWRKDLMLGREEFEALVEAQISRVKKQYVFVLENVLSKRERARANRAGSLLNFITPVQ